MATPARQTRKDGQTPCGVGCCTGAATSLPCPCTSIFCFLIGLGRTPAVPALTLTAIFGGTIPLPLTYPFIIGACAGGAASPTVGKPPECGVAGVSALGVTVSQVGDPRKIGEGE